MNRFLFISLLILLFGFGVLYHLYNQPMASLESEKADYEFTAEQLFDFYQANEANADQKLLDKTLLVKGTVKSLVTEGNQLSVILESGDDLGNIVCELDARLWVDQSPPKPGEAVNIKGVCTGMLLNIDVILLRCVLVS
jgi:hypothetical protein